MAKQTHYDKQLLYIYWKVWEKAGITYINHIINKTNGHFMTHDELQAKYNIKTNHIATLQIYSSLPNYWIKTLKERIYCTPLANIQNSIYINKSKLNVEKVKCKEYYRHLIKNFSHLPKAISLWENIYINFKNKDDNFWKTIFKMPFICSRHTTIQTFQYKITHRILACNEWLNNIKIKICNTCSFCNDKDTISHFLIDCNSNKFFLEKLG